jgi:hypothetical protein
VSYDTAKPLIEQVQSLTVSKNVTSDIAKMVGFTGEDIANTTVASQLQSLSRYSDINIKGILGDLYSQGQANKQTRLLKEQRLAFEASKAEFYTRYNNASDKYNKEASEASSAYQYFKTVEWGIGSRRIDDQIMGANGLYAYQAQEAERVTAYNILQELEKEKTLKGFKVGGYTGNGPIDEIAGYTHRKEYVVNAPDLQAIGGPDELKNMIEREKRSKSTINSNIGISNSKDDIIQQLGNQINILEKGFNIMINKLSDLVDFNEERKANKFPVIVSGTVTAIGA